MDKKRLMDLRHQLTVVRDQLASLEIQYDRTMGTIDWIIEDIERCRRVEAHLEKRIAEVLAEDDA